MRTISSHKCAIAAITILYSTLAYPPQARAQTSTSIITKSVNDYSYYTLNVLHAAAAHAHDNDTHCNDEANNFASQVSTNPSSYSIVYQDQDSNVWDSDYKDPDRSGNASDGDTSYFDIGGFGIAFTCTHGFCDTKPACTATPHNTQGTCPAGQVCVFTLDGQICLANTPRAIVTSSASSIHGNVVKYGDGTVAWGEDAYSGTFAGAGSNGALNLTVLINSCGLNAPFYNYYASAFAGVHAVAGIMPLDGDTADVAARGTDFGAQLIWNVNSPVSDGWFTTEDQMNGINGDGAYYLLSYDDTQADAQWHTWNETFDALQYDANDAVGNGYGWIYWHCNYDCNTNPF